MSDGTVTPLVGALMKSLPDVLDDALKEASTPVGEAKVEEALRILVDVGDRARAVLAAKAAKELRRELDAIGTEWKPKIELEREARARKAREELRNELDAIDTEWKTKIEREAEAREVREELRGELKAIDAETARRLQEAHEAFWSLDSEMSLLKATLDSEALAADALGRAAQARKELREELKAIDEKYRPDIEREAREASEAREACEAEMRKLHTGLAETSEREAYEARKELREELKAIDAETARKAREASEAREACEAEMRKLHAELAEASEREAREACEAEMRKLHTGLAEASEREARTVCEAEMRKLHETNEHEAKVSEAKRRLEEAAQEFKKAAGECAALGIIPTQAGSGASVINVVADSAVDGNVAAIPATTVTTIEVSSAAPSTELASVTTASAVVPNAAGPTL